MTAFELERIEAVFEYLEDRLLAMYDEELKSEDKQLVRKIENLICRDMDRYDEVKNALRRFGLYEASDASISERSFNAESNYHVFSFGVSTDKMPWEEYIQDGQNAEQAEHHLRSHLAFARGCEPEKFKVKLIARFS